MLSNYNNISLKYKIGLIVLLPSMAMLALVLWKLSIVQGNVNTQNKILTLMQVSVAANSLVHELQKERGFSAGFVNGKGKKFKDSLLRQRVSTDSKYEFLNEILDDYGVDSFGNEYAEQIKVALSGLDRIKEIRNSVNTLNVELVTVVNFYTNANKELLDISKKAIFASQDPVLQRDISAYYYFLQSKERSGLERAVGAAGFGGGWSRALGEKFTGFIHLQDTYISIFLGYATPKEKAFYDEISATAPFSDVAAMRDIAKKNYLNADYSETVDAAG